MTVTISQLFEDESYLSILQRLLDRISDDIDKAEGSYIYDAVAPNAFEHSKQAAFFRFVIEQAFALLAEGEYLDKMAADFGISRAAAIPATVGLEFTGTPGITIPAGTRVAVQATEIMFATDQEGIIGAEGTVTIPATCTTAGTDGNVPNDVVNVLVDFIPNVEEVTNPSPATGGVDAESDDVLRVRILFFKRNPERGGTATDYVRWALSVSGVQAAHVVALSRGIGSVDVVIGAPPAEIDDLVPLVQAVVDLKKPLGVDAIVIGATIQEEDFRITVSGITALEAEDAATEYLNTVGIGGTVIFSKLIAALIQAGATDAYLTEPEGTRLELSPDSVLYPNIYITVV